MTLLLDCSFTRLQRAASGIPRVVRGLAEHLPAAAGAWGPVQCVAYHRDGLRAAHLDPGDRGDGRAEAPARGGWHRLYRAAEAPALRRAVKRALPVALQVSAWRLFSRAAFSRLAQRLPPATARAGDLLVLGDAGWTYDAEAMALAARRGGARIATIVYDLIPISSPQYCAPVHRRLFARWLEGALRYSDALLCISEATRRELEAHCAARGLRCPPAAAFRLGGDLPSSPLAPGAEDAVARLAGQGAFFLAVGSIEPRKNYDFLLETFARCWERGIEATLVIVGRPVDGAQATLARLRRHPEQGRRLHVLTAAGDAELAALYSRARAVVLASLAEGFGLPLVEARQRGCEVFASRLPAFEEIADAGVRLFAPNDGAALEALISRAAATPRDPDLAPMPAFGWRDSAAQFISALSRTLSPGARAIPPSSAS